VVPEFAFERILEVLARHGVQFVVVGAVAAIAQGSPLPTEDVDITPARDAVNLERLASALDELEARLRVANKPEGVAFPFDAAALERNEIWTLTTPHGDLDIVFVPAGTEGYEDLRRSAIVVDFGSVQVSMASLADVIRSKQAAGRPKDLSQLPALRQTLEIVRERERSAQS
jgi:predicted nucleotidyltransferase